MSALTVTTGTAGVPSGDRKVAPEASPVAAGEAGVPESAGTVAVGACAPTGATDQASATTTARANQSKGRVGRCGRFIGSIFSAGAPGW